MLFLGRDRNNIRRLALLANVQKFVSDRVEIWRDVELRTCGNRVTWKRLMEEGSVGRVKVGRKAAMR